LSRLPADDALKTHRDRDHAERATGGQGDGNDAPDAIVGDGVLLIRAERSATGDGRVYRIAFTADDGLRGSCRGSVTVSGPKSAKGDGLEAVDSCQLHDAARP
jgi:hypothetical protein